MQAATQTMDSVVRNWRMCFILASGLLFAAVVGAAEDPPANLVRLIAARETETAQAQSNYTYRQTVTLDELSPSGLTQGTYREVRDVIFSPAQERSEQMVGKPSETLTHLKLTDEDFRDIREVQPFLLTKDQAFLYETTFRGEETVAGFAGLGISCGPR